MHGLMMDGPLLIPGILRRAARFFADRPIVWRDADGGIGRSTYGESYGRVVRLMNALRGLGIGPGDRVATFAWNHRRHFELYYAVPGLGAVLHTVNVRLPADQLRFILNHAGSRLIFVDRSLTGLLAPLRADLTHLEQVVTMEDRGPSPPEWSGPSVDYEAALAAASDREAFPDLDENAASGLCYTSGTTGDPKGVLYSHRSTYLHALVSCMADASAISERDTVLPVVPMFHVNAWGFPYIAALAGAKIVLPGPFMLDGPLAALIEAERVTFASGVPTIWARLFDYLKGAQPRHDLSSLRTIFVGGSAIPRSLVEGYDREHGITVVQGWGMTETSPIGTICRPRSEMEGWDPERLLDVRVKQGVPLPLFEVRIVDDLGSDLPWDGRQAGELLVRGPWVARSYYQLPQAEAAFTPEGWFRTGDVATIDPKGYVQLTDRKKDLIKRKGEWISSVDMENAALAHPGVMEAAVVARPDAIAGEAPVLLVVRRPGIEPAVEPADLLTLLGRTFADWQLPRPGDVRFVATLPRTSVGKLDKKALRRGLAELP